MESTRGRFRDWHYLELRRRSDGFSPKPQRKVITGGIVSFAPPAALPGVACTSIADRLQSRNKN